LSVWNALIQTAGAPQGDFMATAIATPTREDFAAMLEESFTQGGLLEAPSPPPVVKGIVVGIEKDMAVIDVGAKTEGRVAVREFSGPGRGGEIKVGDEVEVYWSASRTRSVSRAVARQGAREESWRQAEKPSRTTRRSPA